MKRSCLFLITIAGFFALAQETASSNFASSLSLDPSMTLFGQSAEVDWTAGIIRAQGAGTAASGLTLAQAKLRALGAARADATRLLATAVGEIRVTGDTLVRDYVLDSDTVRVQIDALLRGVRYPEAGERIEQMSDGSFIVYAIAEISLYGRQDSSLVGVIYPLLREAEQAVATTPLPAEPLPADPTATPAPPIAREEPPAPAPEPTGPGDDQYVPLGAYTGLVIDASSFSIDATMAPRIFSADGQTVYGIMETSTAFANDVGVVGYHRSLDSALADQRVGNNPLIIAAIDVIGRGIFTEHPVINGSDAMRVAAEDAESGFLREARVAIVGQ